MLAAGIRFNDCFFSEPACLAGWNPPKCAGLLAILVTDLNWAPRPFQPLYFGEFGNNAPAASVLEEFHSLAIREDGRTLLVAVLPMPFSTRSERLAARNELLLAYNPTHAAQEREKKRLQPGRRIGFMPYFEPAAAQPGY